LTIELLALNLGLAGATFGEKSGWHRPLLPVWRYLMSGALF